MKIFIFLWGSLLTKYPKVSHKDSEQFVHFFFEFKKDETLTYGRQNGVLPRSQDEKK